MLPHQGRSKIFNTIQLTMSVTATMPKTNGINTALILSASCLYGQLFTLGLFHHLKNAGRTVSSPIAVTCAFTVPSVTTLPPMSISFAFYEAGRFHQWWWLHLHTSPQSILQSIGTCSPLLINKRSPTCSMVFSTGNICSLCSSSKAIMFAITFCDLASLFSSLCVGR